MPPIFDVTFAAGAPLDLTRDLLYGAAVTSTLAARSRLPSARRVRRAVAAATRP